MPKQISQKMQRAINLMAQGWSLKYHLKARKNWYQLSREHERETVHAGTASGMITSGLVVSNGISDSVETFSLTEKGRALEEVKHDDTK